MNGMCDTSTSPNVMAANWEKPGRNVREAHARQHRVEGRVLDTDAMQHQEPCRVERLRLEESGHCRPLCCRERSRLRKEFIPLRRDVLGNEAGDLQDLFRRELRHCHDLPTPYFIAPRSCSTTWPTPFSVVAASRSASVGEYCWTEPHPVPDRKQHLLPIYFAGCQAVQLLFWPVLLGDVPAQDDDTEF